MPEWDYDGTGRFSCEKRLIGQWSVTVRPGVSCVFPRDFPIETLASSRVMALDKRALGEFGARGFPFLAETVNPGMFDECNLISFRKLCNYDCIHHTFRNHG
ncbi:tRNA/rRNA methyltransferase SpoU [Anopheles sinensis]|uniref:tRNA/rRNA methyltransferase SpoU n=1 Tax=Anopheles sinensis TaxID=74873 RepID=A0A084WUI2_ANOSI|nr:tRNA/rRNA methyltransferase SpoU [Anopheles sinensis]